MKKLKFILNKKGYFSHIGTDLVNNSIELNGTWNLSNHPTKFHYWDSEKQDFILDESLENKSNKILRLNQLNDLLDKNKQKLIENKVIYTEADQKFLEYEENLRNERKYLLEELKQLKN